MQNFVQMNRFYRHWDGFFGHPFLQVQPPKTGEVEKSSLELKCFGECRVVSLHPAA